MNFKLILTCIVSIVIASSCTNTVRKDGTEEVIYSVGEDDAEMNEAIRKANATLNDFKKALIGGDTMLRLFSIKIKVDTDDGRVEHIWIGSIEMKGDTLSGRVDNIPQSISSLTESQFVRINTSDISDWMYVRNDTLIGGYTIRVLRNRMSVEERRRLDEEIGVTVQP